MDKEDAHVLVRNTSSLLSHMSTPTVPTTVPSNGSLASSPSNKESPVKLPVMSTVTVNGGPNQSTATFSGSTDRESSNIKSSAPTKSSVYNNMSSSDVAIKILVSNNMAGSIIGRSGQTITNLQEQSSARIKLSQTGDCFPGTDDRVCLVQGSIIGTKEATHLILRKMHDHQTLFTDIHHDKMQSYESYEDDNENDISTRKKKEVVISSLQDSNARYRSSVSVRVLVPVLACGMIIGRGGSNIKSMTAFSGVSSIRLSPRDGKLFRSTPPSTASVVAATSERVVTITGSQISSCITCVHLMLDDIKQNLDVCRYSNMTTSYTKITNSQSMTIPSSDSVNDTILKSTAVQPFIDSDKVYLGTSPLYPTAQVSDGITIPQDQEIIRINPQQQVQIGDGSTKSNAISLCDNSYHVTLPSSSSTNFPSASYELPTRSLVSLQQSQPLNQHFETSRGRSFLLNHGSQNFLQLDNNVGQINVTSGTLQSTIGQNHVVQQGYPHSIQIALSENIIGAIFGRGGRTLKQLQSSSNANIKVSQFGVFKPGSYDRIVTISGQTMDSVTTAQYLINQEISKVSVHETCVSKGKLQEHEAGSIMSQQKNGKN